jgi:transcriptional regulator with XRE-family HTH domain
MPRSFTNKNITELRKKYFSKLLIIREILNIIVTLLTFEKPNTFKKTKAMKSLGKKIRLLRHQKGWSQEDVAKRLGISIPAFSKIETSITDINLSRLEQIANLFEMPVVQLLTFSDSEQDQKFVNELEVINQKLIDRETEVISLQKKVIELFEELRHSKATV